jgi:CDP-3, 6-dideoxy-D-glycero-L-glycero-4-hexulose-4-reductase
LKLKILITGSTGFVGSNIINLLLKKNVYIYDILRNKNKKNSKIEELKNNKNYSPIFFQKFNELEIKLKKIKVDIVINCATYYTGKNDIKNIENLVQTNIIFCSIILEILKNKIKKFINFGSMMEYSQGKNFSPKNFYAITKYSFQKIEEFYKIDNKNIKFYNLKLYETYGDNDVRKKIIPTIIKSYSKNKIIKIVSKNLKMNFVHIESLMRAIYMIIFNEIKEGEYCLKNNKFIKIHDLINSLNKKLKKKIKVKYLSSKNISDSYNQLKNFPYWKDKKNLEFFLLSKLKKLEK